MLSIPASVTSFLCREPVDFRKAHDGLVAVVRQYLQTDPLSGSLFVFFNKRRDKVKLLQWDGNGLWLHYKRLEKGTFPMTANTDSEDHSISRAQLAMLLEGMELRKGKIVRRFADSIRIRERRGGDNDEQHSRVLPSFVVGQAAHFDVHPVL